MDVVMLLSSIVRVRLVFTAIDQCLMSLQPDLTEHSICHNRCPCKDCNCQTKQQATTRHKNDTTATHN